MKKIIPIKPFWYSDILVIPKVVTIITTVNKQGIVNAAPYSLLVPYDIMHNRPQVLVGMRKFSHTYKNIVATGEFVVNFPSAEFLEDVMETSRFYREGMCELDHTKFTSIASQKVSPPSLKECKQHIECTLHKNFEIGPTQAKVIGDIAAIVVDEDLLLVNRGERISRLNLPVYLGDEKRKYFYYSTVKSSMMIEHQPPPKEGEEAITLKLEWDEEALRMLSEIPSFVQQMVAEMVEDLVTKEGSDAVTHERFIQLMKEYAPGEVLERFEDE
ncbi:MAG: flavin reductase [Proteobacteria bacterium]|nr:flavin reductase [Pseudomonadota bacterium]